MKKNPLNLYVWEDVLIDWSDGIMFALASSEEEARKLILEKCGQVPAHDLNKKPRCVEKSEGFVLWGGG